MKRDERQLALTSQCTRPRLALLASAGDRGRSPHCWTLHGDLIESGYLERAVSAAIAGGYYVRVLPPLHGEVLRRLDDALRREVLAFAETYRIPIAEVSPVSGKARTENR